MFSSIFEKLRFPNEAQPQQGSSAPPPTGSASQSRPDQEEDGFLIVGETASERTIIMPAHHVPGGQACPPSYSQLQQSASQPVQTAASGAWASHLPSSLTPSSNQQITSDETDSQIGNNSTYAAIVTRDIPFRLSEQLHVSQKLATDMSYFAVPPLEGYNPTKYLYDFEEERRVLRETAGSYE